MVQLNLKAEMAFEKSAVACCGNGNEDILLEKTQTRRRWHQFLGQIQGYTMSKLQRKKIRQIDVLTYKLHTFYIVS